MAFREGQGKGFNLKRSGEFLVFLDHADEPFASGLDHFHARANLAVRHHAIHRKLSRKQWGTLIFSPRAKRFSTSNDRAVLTRTGDMSPGDVLTAEGFNVPTTKCTRFFSTKA